jgi:hypothetical protein
MLPYKRRRLITARGALFSRDDSGARIPWTHYGQEVSADDFTDTSVAWSATVAAAATAAAAAGAAVGGGLLSRLAMLAASAGAALPVTDAAARPQAPPGATPAPAGEEAPMKTLRVVQLMRLMCGVRYVDIDGRSDATSVRNLLEELAPQLLVVVHGTPASASNLGAMCRAFCAKVVTPAAGEAVDASSGISTFLAKLRDSFYSSIRFARVGGYELSFVDAELAPGSTTMLTQLSALPPGHRPALLRVGALRIPDVRKRLAKAGIASDVAEGGLVTEGGILVRRAGAAAPGFGFELEGPPTLEYYAVRAVLYDMYTMV